MIGLLIGAQVYAQNAPTPPAELRHKIFGNKVSVLVSCQLGNKTASATLDLSRPFHNNTAEGWFPNSSYVAQAYVNLQQETVTLRFRDYFGKFCHQPETCVTKPLRNGEQIKFEVANIEAKDSNGNAMGGKLSCNAMVKVDTEGLPNLSQFPEDPSFQPIRVTGADAEVIYTLIAQPGYTTSNTRGDYVICIPGRCRMGTRDLRWVGADSSGFYNDYLARLGIPEARNLVGSTPSLGLQGERRFDVVCVTEPNSPGRADSGIANVKECTLSPRTVGMLSPEDSAKVLSLLSPDANRVVDAGDEFIDTYVYCQSLEGDGYVQQRCVYTTSSFWNLPVKESAPLWGTHGKDPWGSDHSQWYETVDRTKGQWVIQSLLRFSYSASSGSGSNPTWDNSHGRILCDTKRSLCQVIRM